MATLDLIGSIAFIGGLNGAYISQMFDLGLTDVILHALSIEENSSCVRKAMYICSNIINDEMHLMLKVIQGASGGEIFEKCVEILVSS